MMKILNVVNVAYSMQRLGIKIIAYASLNSENHKIINIELSFPFSVHLKP